MKNLSPYLILLIAVTVIFSFSSNVYAVEGEGSQSVSIHIENPLRSGVDTIPKLVEIIINAVVQIGVPVVAVGIIYSGFLFVKAQGKPEAITKAKEVFMWTIVGALIILGAFVILEIVQGTIDQLK
ncbi:MAG: hypothetical protein A2589_02540 [Candidatus Vogelbacteria bacterium RIFOXYD1_FULL_46_19]|uniref:TrbC/VIRB2 family protein n=1 Tax=Candidatus Vogelbacteria bacterium RIFOXYD1_FULL_46_19 TaxID=1802439 RepID=A0A1G2QH38_9BACT|nr:MAG: hypothetical protein A2589_02540 [Candidatus Vogelbacteria bacterium RIFOXYD1_FULL_46_19]